MVFYYKTTSYLVELNKMKIKFDIEKSEFELNHLYKNPFLFKSAAKDIDLSWDYVNEVYSHCTTKEL